MKTDTLDIKLAVTTETATVYRGGGRRFFTKKAAYRAEMRSLINKRCDCDSSTYHLDGYQCEYHGDPERYEAVICRGVRMMMFHDKKQFDTTNTDTPKTDQSIIRHDGSMITVAGDKVAWADTARELERERDALIKRVEEYDEMEKEWREFIGGETEQKVRYSRRYKCWNCGFVGRVSNQARGKIVICAGCKGKVKSNIQE